jgi:hypothetical protein
LAEQREQRGGDRANMVVRVVLTRAAEAHGFEASKPEILEPQLRVLTSEHDRRPATASGQRMDDGCHFYCFRPGADDQPDIGETQYSP